MFAVKNIQVIILTILKDHRWKSMILNVWETQKMRKDEQPHTYKLYCSIGNLQLLPYKIILSLHPSWGWMNFLGIFLLNVMKFSLFNLLESQGKQKIIQSNIFYPKESI
jgi:hypothetical protein